MRMTRKAALKTMALSAAALAGGSATASVSAAHTGMGQEPDKAEHWRKSALLIVDMQNDFVRVGAPLEVPDARKTIPVHRNVIRAFRSRNLPVIYTKFLSRPHYYMLWDWSPQCAPPTKCCWKGHERYYKDIQASRACTDIIDELAPEGSDTTIEKYGYGAFHGTDLASIVRSYGLNSLVITGTVTQICVEESAREAFHHGFRTTIVEDAVSSFAPDLHAATLKNFAMKFGWLADSSTIISNLA